MFVCPSLGFALAQIFYVVLCICNIWIIAASPVSLASNVNINDGGSGAAWYIYNSQEWIDNSHYTLKQVLAQKQWVITVHHEILSTENFGISCKSWNICTYLILHLKLNMSII